jgi:DNA-binding ferritin-like protein
VKALAAQVAAVSNASRKAISRSGDLGDMATADLFTEIVRRADKDLWSLEGHLQG